jgi:hypothetical protein
MTDYECLPPETAVGVELPPSADAIVDVTPVIPENSTKCDHWTVLVKHWQASHDLRRWLLHPFWNKPYRPMWVTPRYLVWGNQTVRWRL